MTRFGDERLPTRFWAKVHTVASGCWEWHGSMNRPNGYGQFWIAGRLRLAHRVAYEALVGDVPDGLDLDHLCRTRTCCNPAHLEAVTRRVNIVRGDRAKVSRDAAARITHCLRGHEYTEANTYRKRQGGRQCRTCSTARLRARDEELRRRRIEARAALSTVKP